MKGKPESQKNDDKPKRQAPNTTDRLLRLMVVQMKLQWINNEKGPLAEMDPTETSASEFAPYLLHIPVHIVIHINSIVMCYSP